ncbi:heavy-metal-associated domain-containing protein [Candidatus Peregrinibacteria bacterium]|nr:heavy-metal-associated domain-containing protein [Candidatus Peregrinibacteria bacterium]
MQTQFTITGTHCRACRLLIEEACKEIPGVFECNVDFETGNTLLVHDSQLDLDIVKKNIESLSSYKVKL